jgi:high-affinity nickel-transport protein
VFQLIPFVWVRMLMVKNEMESISLITIMGLVGDNCTQCKKAAEAPDGGGIAGRWWRGWARANTNSGYIGAAIVGGFVAVVCMWYGAKWLSRIRRSRRVQEGAGED